MNPAVETDGQRSRRLLGASLNATWPNTRTSSGPRGIQRKGMACYRVSTLQMLAHMPKFVNWIMEHMEPGMDWPCNENDLNTKLPLDQETDPAILGMNQDQILGCVSCRLKAFFTAYWSNQRGDTDSELTALRYEHASVLPLHVLGERWFCKLPQLSPSDRKGADEPNDAWIARRIAGETLQQRNRRLRNARGQQSSDEYLSHILDGIATSIHPDNHARLGQLNALFQIQVHQENVCAHCNQPREVSAPANYPYTTLDGFLRILFHESRSTKLLDTIKQFELGSETNDALICEDPACRRAGAVTTRRIEAAPQYIRAFIILSSLDKNKQETTLKYRDRDLEIPSTLDLTELAYVPDEEKSAWPMEYKLISVLYHTGGNIASGHWTAGVSCPPLPQKRKRQGSVEKTTYYLCNDSTINELPKAEKANRDGPLVQNPQPQTGGNSVVLMYERVNRRPRRLLGNLSTSLEQGYYNYGSGAPKFEDGDNGKGDNDKKDGDTSDDEKEDPRGDSDNEGDNNYEQVVRRSKRRRVVKSYKGMC